MGTNVTRECNYNVTREDEVVTWLLQLTGHASLYSQKLGFRQGACKRVEGVYMEYMTEKPLAPATAGGACNAAENPIAVSIYTGAFPITETGT